MHAVRCALGVLLATTVLSSAASARDVVGGAWHADTTGSTVACLLAEDAGRRVRGTCEVDGTGDRAAGVFDVAGRRSGPVARIAAARADGLRLTATARLAGSRLILRFHVAGRGLRFAGRSTMARTDATEPYSHWLYDATCAGCHGTDARGLAGPSVRCTVDVATPVRAGLAGGMPAFTAAQLDDASVAAIAGWLASQCAADGPDVLGADLYASNCARCHGADADGGRTPDGIRVPSVRCRDTAVIVGEMIAGDDPMPAFPQLTPTEQGAIVDWVHGRCPVP